MPESARQSGPAVILLMGPTASGKTELAIELAGQLDCELVSVDSALVYRGMDIGTAKPSAALRQRIPHRLVDIRDPEESYSAAEFRRDALAAIDEIHAAGRAALLVGGTMLYFRVLLRGIAELPAADRQTRQRITAMLRAGGTEALHRELQTLDPAAAARIHPNNSQRLQRALEVCYLSGRPMSALQAESGAAELPWRTLQLAIAPYQREILHQRIAERFTRMLRDGLVDEVRRIGSDLDPNLPAMRAVGYRQVLAHLRGELSYPQMVERGIIATRQLAKRQLTWLRSWSDLNWVLTDAAQNWVEADGSAALMEGQPRSVLDRVLKLIESAAI